LDGKPAQQLARGGLWQSFIEHRLQTDGRKAKTDNRPAKSEIFSVPADVVKGVKRRTFRVFGVRSCRGMNVNNRKEMVLTSGQTAGCGLAYVRKKGSDGLNRG
jgi:hypothetical protein